MKEYIIKTRNGKDVLFKGSYPCIKTCIEDALQTKNNINGADLTGQDLSNINLDNEVIEDIDFSSSNLTGANLSEAHIKNCTFENTDLYNACLAYAKVKKTSFKNANFGATDIMATHFVSCEFSGLGCFTLNFKNAQTMRQSTYLSACNKIMPLCEPPVVITGLSNKPVIMMNDAVWRGHDLITNRGWLGFLNQKISA